MICVEIMVNGQVVARCSAKNQGDVADGLTRYQVKDGPELLHDRSQGAAALAIQMLGILPVIRED